VNGSGEMSDNKSTGRKVKALNRDVAVFTFFLFLSFGLWYINSLGKEAEADIRYPFRYINIPKDRELTGDEPAKLNFSLRGPGYTILKLKVTGNKAPVLIDLSKVSYRRAPEGRNTDYYIVTSGLQKSFTVQIRSGCEIISIKPDTLFFSLSRPLAKINNTR
jgi:hypothetical protein